MLAITNIGTAVVLFPILRRHSEALALGYVAARVLESTVIVVGIVSLLAVLDLRQAIEAGADETGLAAAARSLVALHEGTFLLGPGFVAGFANGLMLGYLMYKSGLVPRPLALIGVIGGPLAVASGIAALFGLYEQASAWSALATVPEMVWEASLGVWLIVKGFRPAPVLAGASAAAPVTMKTGGRD